MLELDRDRVERKGAVAELQKRVWAMLPVTMMNRPCNYRYSNDGFALFKRLLATQAEGLDEARVQEELQLTETAFADACAYVERWLDYAEPNRECLLPTLTVHQQALVDLNPEQLREVVGSMNSWVARKVVESSLEQGQAYFTGV